MQKIVFHYNTEKSNHQKGNKQIHYLDLTKKMFNVKTNTYRIFNYNEMDKAGYMLRIIPQMKF